MTGPNRASWRLLALPLLLASACTVGSNSMESLSDGSQISLMADASRPQAPPGSMSMQATPFWLGRTATVTVSDAPANRTVYLLASGNPGAPPACPPQLAPTCLDIGQFTVLGQSTADASGVATFNINLPNSLPIPLALLQAAAIGGGEVHTSHVLEAEFLDAEASDLDGDGLSDAEELDVYGTDPLNPDTDGGGVDDGTEVLDGTDPTVADDDQAQSGDSDGDGLSDEVELDMGTDPYNPDSDGDLLTDGEELEFGTDPLHPDTDGDALIDGAEVFLFGTDPLAEDTDGGGEPDAVEIAYGRDPLDPSDDLLIDTDGDGIPDCYDHEECDGIDNDGDGEIDEGFDANDNGIPDCEEEACDCIDNNGDGQVDEFCDYRFDLEITADDAYDVWLDGAPLGSGIGWADSELYNATLTGGTHHVAVHAWDIARVVAGMAATVRIDGSVSYGTGWGDWRASFTDPGAGWQTDPSLFSMTPNPVNFNWPAPAFVANDGIDWVWTRDGRAEHLYPENWFILEFDVCGETLDPPVEECNGIDDDGDGLIDEDFPDSDGDGIADCVDDEECDGIDNDGDGQIDEGWPDSDYDGIADCVDEEVCDGLDNNGDGQIDEGFPDSDDDGVADCVDVPEICDGIDNDGNGLIDEGFDADGDGIADCFDPELCDGVDNDGDGEIDEGFDLDMDGIADCFDDMVCGNGILEGGEECDDGNMLDGDGCSSTCEIACVPGQFGFIGMDIPAGPGGAEPNWVLDADGTVLRQLNNAAPSIYASSVPAGTGQDIVFTIKVEETVDDDYIGFTLGYDPGEYAQASQDYLVVAWKQGQQGALPPGLSVVRVNGPLNSHTELYLGQGNATEIARGMTVGSSGWTDFAEHEFLVQYTATSLKIFVDGVLEIDETGTFPTGTFGFYNASQSNVRYELLEPLDDLCEEECDCEDNDGDGLIDEDCDYTLDFTATADDEFDAWLDGTYLGGDLGWSNADTFSAPITGGTHHLAVHAKDVARVVAGFMSATHVNGNLISVTGDGSWLASPQQPGPNWQTDPSGYSGPGNVVNFNWPAPQVLYSFGADWIWLEDGTREDLYPENYFLLEFDVCGDITPPLLRERCNGIDDNGNGLIDEGFPDSDGDGIADCVDVEEECDGIDNDGDGLIDDGFPDSDYDGIADCVDEEECDGLDNDGDGETDEGYDIDGDGIADCFDEQICGNFIVEPGEDCDDGANDDDTDGCSSDCMFTEVEEICGDCIDNNGDGQIDEACYELAFITTADDEMDAYIDGAFVGTSSGWSTIDTYTAMVGAGTHHVAAEAYDLGGAVVGFRSAIQVDGATVTVTGDGTWLSSPTNPGTGWQTDPSLFSNTPSDADVCAPGRWGPLATFDALGAGWVWDSNCFAPSGARNFYIHEVQICEELPVAEPCDCEDNDGDGLIDEDCSYELEFSYEVQNGDFESFIDGTQVDQGSGSGTTSVTVMGGMHTVSTYATTTVPNTGYSAAAYIDGQVATTTGDGNWTMDITNPGAAWQGTTLNFPVSVALSDCGFAAGQLQADGAQWAWLEHCSVSDQYPENWYTTEFLVCGERGSETTEEELAELGPLAP